MFALFSLPLVTANGRVRSVDNPRGKALKYLCGINYKASTLDKHISELKYLQVSNELIEVTVFMTGRGILDTSRRSTGMPI